MSKRSYGLMIAIALVMAAVGALLPYWLWSQAVADIVSLVWLVLWVVLFWPVYYHVLWRFRVKRRIG